MCTVLVSAQDEQVKDTEDKQESKFSLNINGEFDLSKKNYSENRFYSEKGVLDEKSSKATVPGICFTAGYKITPKWEATLSAEYVSDYGMQLDELNLKHIISPAFSITGGFIMLPIGHCNTDYGYTDYFTNADPEGEFSLIPCPMTEMGISLSGDLDCGLSYYAAVSAGMNAYNFTYENWAHISNQGFFNDDINFNSPAYTLRLGYYGLKNFQCGAGVYYCSNTTANMPNYRLYKEFCKDLGCEVRKTPTTIWYADAQYQNDYITVRGSYLQGNISDISNLNAFYDFGSAAKGAISLMGEVGLNLKNCFYRNSNGPALFPFVHYEYYDSHYKVDEGQYMDPRGQVNAFSFGLNWKPIEEVAVKCNCTARKIGGKDFNDANEVNFAIAYNFDVF